MKEIIVKIPDENSEVKKYKGPRTTTSSEKISPTYLFGKWKNLDIDAKQIRKEAWDRSHKYL